MRLRNKKTGEIVERSNIVTLRYKISSCSSSLVEAEEYSSIRQLNEEWEDYEPAEPLIKDKKIREAVRAWAEANGLNYANCYESEHAWYLRAFNSREQGIDIDIEFWGYQLPKELKDCETHTITELCGEEKECES